MLLIFDCDGVIIDSMLLHTEIESQAYREIGIEIAPEALRHRFAGIPQSVVAPILAKEQGRSVPADFDPEKPKAAYFKDRLKAIPHIEDTLKELSGFPACIASGSTSEMLDLMLSQVALHHVFAPHIYSSDRVKRGKPFPDLFLFAAEKFNTHPRDCIVIEDGIAGLQAAKAAKMRSIGFTGGSHCDDIWGDRLRAEGAENVVADMRELPGLIRQMAA